MIMIKRCTGWPQNFGTSFRTP